MLFVLTDPQDRGHSNSQKAISPAQVRGRASSAEQDKVVQPPMNVAATQSNPSTTDSTPLPGFIVHAGPAAKRGPQFVPKDARMERINTTELKEFFRSTGPDFQHI